MWWPLLLTGLLELHTRPGHERWSIWKVGLGGFLIETGGYPLTKILILVGTAAGYLLMARRHGGWRAGPRWSAIAIAGLGAILASAPDWVSTLRALPFSDRLEANIYDQYTYGAPSNFLTLGTALLPSVFLARGMQLGMLPLERSWWIGSLTVLVILMAAYARVIPWRRLRPAAVVALAAFLFSLGGHSFFRELVSFIVTPFEHLRHSNNARILTMAFAIFLGGVALTALEARYPWGGAESKGHHVAIAWGAFLLLAAIAAISEGNNRAASKLLYRDFTAGWKVEALHTGFYLLLGYTAFRGRPRFTRAYGWPFVVVAVQLLSMADAGYAFRQLIAIRSEKPLKGAEAFVVASPQPNRRSLPSREDGLDAFSYGGNDKLLNAYNPPSFHLLNKARKDPELAPRLQTLVSCLDRMPGHSCQGIAFEITRYFGNTIEVVGASPDPAMIVVHDFWDPNWSVTVNDKPGNVIPVLRFFKGAGVPSGQWTVRFEYRDPALPALWITSAVGLALLALGPLLVRSGRAPRT
jgi:hypothetical protein